MRLYVLALLLPEGPNGTDISTDDGENWTALRPKPSQPATHHVRSYLRRYLFTERFSSAPDEMRKLKRASMTTINETFAEVIMLFKGDSQRGPMQLPLQKLAEILLSDLQAAWKEAGVGPYEWNVDPKVRHQSSAYPALYEIQSYVAFSYDCNYGDVRSLLEDSARALKVVHSEAAKRALGVLIAIASRQSRRGEGISFRSRVIVWPPRTEVTPGLPEVDE